MAEFQKHNLNPFDQLFFQFSNDYNLSQSFIRFFIHNHYGDYHYHLTIKIIFCNKANEIQKAKFNTELAIFRIIIFGKDH